jgi:hypothetical protein
MEQLKSEIIRFVNERWKMNESPTFLAFLGSRLSLEAKNELRRLGIPLKSFIKDYLRDSVRYFAFGDGGDALVPALATKDLTDGQLISRRANEPRKPRSSRYLNDVWKAFERPMRLDKRYLQLADGRAVFYDLDAGDPQPENSIEVRKQDVPAIDPMRGVAAPYDVGNAIQAWAEAHKINIQSLYEPASPSSVKAPSSPHSPDPGVVGIQRLIGFLEILEPNDLNKVNIPSDVLLNILKRGSGP